MKFISKKGREYPVISVTSCKGGIGKSTVTAGLAETLSARGNKVVVIDCDFSNRSLDILLGFGDDFEYDITDLAAGRVAPVDCCRIKNDSRLVFIPGPAPGSSLFDSEALDKAVNAAGEAFSPDIVIIDTPGASDGVLKAASAVADAGIIVVSHNPTSVRGAEKTGELLSGYGLDDQYLIINRFDGKSAGRDRTGISLLIDSTHIPLLGIIPESRKLELAGEKGIPVTNIKHDRKKAGEAFNEIAARIEGERIPLMSFLSGRKRKKLILS